jgi:hypothetical protein
MNSSCPTHKEYDTFGCVLRMMRYIVVLGTYAYFGGWTVLVKTPDNKIYEISIMLVPYIVYTIVLAEDILALRKNERAQKGYLAMYDSFMALYLCMVLSGYTFVENMFWGLGTHIIIYAYSTINGTIDYLTYTGTSSLIVVVLVVSFFHSNYYPQPQRYFYFICAVFMYLIGGDHFQTRATSSCYYGLSTGVLIGFLGVC